jgi:DNA (cytosine-5)-methyltransferase 1
MAQVLQGSNWPPPRTRPSKHNRGYRVPARLTRAERSPVIRKAVVSASLVAEPARYIRACHPEWVVLEQVPAVLPLWEVYATELCALGYCTWCGVLNAADYGVPQSRPRAFLIASRVRAVQRPIATHYDPRKGDQLFGEPWISMADALGWGATDRPSPVVTAGGTAAGGPESFGHRSRELLEQARDAGHWVFRRPATTIQGDPRVSRPGHRDRDRGGESQFAVDSVRVTPEEAAALQGFRPGYPFQGARGKIYEQVGNAIPVQLATHAVAEATGMPIPAETARAA